MLHFAKCPCFAANLSGCMCETHLGRSGRFGSGSSSLLLLLLVFSQLLAHQFLVFLVLDDGVRLDLVAIGGRKVST